MGNTLSEEQMIADGKAACQELLNNRCKGKYANIHKHQLYGRLAFEMKIPVEKCDFDCFTLEQLIQAYNIMINWRKYD